MAHTSYINPFKAVKNLFIKPKTLCYPFTLKEPALRYRGFHTNDWDTCTGCGNCADICPNQAIEMKEIAELISHPEQGLKNERPLLDYGRCCFCGLCVDICPPGSLSLTRDYFHIHFDTGTFTFFPKNEASDSEHFKKADEYSVLKASLTHRKQDFQGFAPDLEYALFQPGRAEMRQVPAEKRVLSFIEQVLGYSREEAVEEASRCLGCRLCEEACPAHLKISDYITAIADGLPEESLRVIYQDNPLPAICGRICMKHCEDACSLRIRGDALAIRWLKRFAADTVKQYQKALEQEPGAATGKKVAVIGAGPGGLSLGYFLRLQGHEVHVYDRLDGGGGTLRTGPPAYRLPVDVIDRDVEYIASLGVNFTFNTEIGKDKKFGNLMKQYDAVFIAPGATQSFSTRVPNAEKCSLALDFLKDNKIGNARAIGKEVIVIGGGNVAMDVARESVRLQHMQHPGQNTVTKIVCLESGEELPASKEEIEEAAEEGIEFHTGWGPHRVMLDGQDCVSGLECRKVKSVFDKKGRFAPEFYEYQKTTVPADMIIEAIGQRPDFSFMGEYEKKLTFTERRKVHVDDNGMTSIPGLFAGGDIVNINLDAVTAIADAKRAAAGIDAFLKK